MPRLAVFAAVAALSAAAPALAQPYAPPAPAAGPQVSVSIAAPLRDPARAYGARDLDELRQDLAQTVQSALSHPRGPAPVAVDLVIEDAKPNRPTFEQLGREPGLSLQSIAIGGARVGGWATLADGSRVPVHFSWYENDLRNELAATTWSDANRAFQMLAADLARGKVPHRYGPGDLSARNADFGDRWPRSRWPQ